jgi:hypothetical protein
MQPFLLYYTLSVSYMVAHGIHNLALSLLLLMMELSLRIFPESYNLYFGKESYIHNIIDNQQFDSPESKEIPDYFVGTLLQYYR